MVDKNSNSSKQSPKIVVKKRFSFKMPKFSFLKTARLKKLNKNAALAASLAAVLLFVGLFSFVFHRSTEEIIIADAAPKEVIEIANAISLEATVTYKTGVTEYKAADDEWKKVPKDLKILQGMSLRTTGATSKAIVTLGDGSIVRLDANTEITFEAITAARIIIVQENGHIYNRVTKSNTRTYVVKTEHGQFQSLGTAFKTTSSGDEESVEVYQSSVQETSTNQKAGEGEKIFVKDFKDPSKDGSISKLDIEEVKKDSFVSWNREKDEENEKFKKLLGFLSDIEGPKISITSPKLGSTIDVDSSAEEGSIEIEGTTEEGATLTVQSKSIPESEVIEVAVTNDGKFKTPVLKAVIGNSIFKFTAKDKTGNETTLNITLFFKKKNIVQEQGIVLTINTTDPSELLFEWGLVGITTSDGVKLVYAETEQPTYPDNFLENIETNSSKTIPVAGPDFKSGKTYYFRVCRYSAATTECDIYSNQVDVDIP